jgi:hypothetical protein
VETFVILDVSSNVSMFAHPWKHCCGNKICFPGSKNVSYQIVSLCFSLMFPSVCPLWETRRNIGRKQCFLVCPGLISNVGSSGGKYSISTISYRGLCLNFLKKISQTWGSSVGSIIIKLPENDIYNYLKKISQTWGPV